MLSAQYRLRDRQAIALTMRRGRPASAESLLIKVRLNQLTSSRAMVVVSKKVAKKAVVRNTIRRRLAAILAEQWATVTPGYDIVITVRDDLSAVPPADLKRRVIAALQRAGLRAAKP